MFTKTCAVAAARARTAVMGAVAPALAPTVATITTAARAPLTGRPISAFTPATSSSCTASWSAPHASDSASAPLPGAVPLRGFASESKRDYYEVLGVSKSADQAALKKAYYQLAKKYHPDTNKDPDAQKKFAEVSAAYDCLRDDTKRAQYDQFGHDAEHFEQAGYGPGPGFNPEDLLRSMFGGGFGGFGGMGGGMGGMGGMDF